jgi:8-hydroxy-5-deazaflavin:NADPH oxidoreductase
MKKVGIIGSANVGTALAKGFLEKGYETTISSRSEEKRKKLEQEIKGVKADTPFNTAKNNELIVFAVKGAEAKKALEEIGAENLAGKTIIDTTNPIADEAPVNGVLVYFSDVNKSLMEELQAAVPGAKFVKAFSCIGSPFMVNPSFESKPTMFICGDDPGAKKEVEGILDQFGWETADMGNVEAARAIEPLAVLWCIPGLRENRWNHALKLLKM